MDRQAQPAQPDQSHPGHAHGTEAGRQELLWLGPETGEAGRIAEVIESALVLVRASSFRGINHHSANRILFGHVSPCREM